MKSKVLTALLSAAIAFGLWLYVITVERTQIEYTFYNVPVVLDGESVLEDRGLMITSDTGQTVTLKLSGNRSDLNKLKSSDITVLVDLTRIYEAGEKKLPYTVSFPGDIQNSAVEVVSRQPDSIELTVAEWSTKEIPVEIKAVGTPADGYMIDEANKTADPKTVNISGPKDLIDQIGMGKLTVNMEGAKESFEQRQKLTLCDAEGNPIDEDLSNVFVDSHMILVKVPVLMEKEISLRLPVVPGGGLEATDVTVTMSFDKITVTGSPAVVSKMADTIELEPIDLSQETESFQAREYTFTLPEGVKSREGNVVEVSLSIPEMDTKPFYVPKSQFEAIGLSEGYKLLYNRAGLTVTLQGRASVLSQVQVTDIRIIVDLTGSTASRFYSVEVVVDNVQGVGAIVDPDNPYEVYVELTPADQEG